MRRPAARGRSLKDGVTAKWGWIPGGDLATTRRHDDETMLIHWEEAPTTKTVPFRRNPLGAGGPPTFQTEAAPHFEPATRRLLRAALETSATGC